MKRLMVLSVILTSLAISTMGSAQSFTEPSKPSFTEPSKPNFTVTPGTVGRARLQLSSVKGVGFSLEGTSPYVIGNNYAVKLMSDDCPCAKGSEAPFSYFGEKIDTLLYKALENDVATAVLLDAKASVLFVDISNDPKLQKLLGAPDIILILGIGGCAATEYKYAGYRGRGCDTCGRGNWSGCFACAVADYDPMKYDDFPLSDLNPGDPLPDWPK